MATSAHRQSATRSGVFRVFTIYVHARAPVSADVLAELDPADLYIKLYATFEAAPDIYPTGRADVILVLKGQSLQRVGDVTRRSARDQIVAGAMVMLERPANPAHVNAKVRCLLAELGVGSRCTFVLLAHGVQEPNAVHEQLVRSIEPGYGICQYSAWVRSGCRRMYSMGPFLLGVRALARTALSVAGDGNEHEE